jgi:hypothetical protein
VTLSWFGDFFSTIPDALEALYLFGDPQARGAGWWGFVILAIWGVFLIGIPLLIAKRTYGEHEWVSATMGVLAALSIAWWVYGILPSAWIYYLDGSKEILEGNIIPASVGLTFGEGEGAYRLAIADDFYLVVRDLVVVIEHLVAFVITFWAALKIQERYPKTLVTGEIKPEAGGYK